MRFHGTAKFSHQQPERTAVLIVNLGSPAAPEPSAVRRYLAQFLGDPRVVEIPRPIWWLILHGIILRIRPARSAAKYRQIWREEGAPLAIMTENLARQLEDRFADRPFRASGGLLVRRVMTYGAPSIAATVRELIDHQISRLLVLPLFPQYSGTTSGAVFDQLAVALQKERWVPDLQFIARYHDHPAYIQACAARIVEGIGEAELPQQLLLSFHGIPYRNVTQGDPYHCHCHKTTRLIGAALTALGRNDLAGRLMTTFQSRFGKAEWLQPYTDRTLAALPSKGIKSVMVFCPGFATDCLETLEEIDMENREIFMKAGGQRFAYLPALNDSILHLDALEAVLEPHLAAWTADRIPDQRAFEAVSAEDTASRT